MTERRRMRCLSSSFASRASRTAFAASAAVALYTAAGYGALLYAGMERAEACVVAALGGVLVAALAGRVVLRTEERERSRRIAQAQLESARERATAPAPPPSPAAAPAAAPTSRELRESREIQAALLPREVPGVDGYHIDVDYQPCGALGGDFYDFRAYEDGKVLVTLGDVSGKGPAGAIVMAMVQTLFRENVVRASGPADLLHRVNEGFRGALGKGVFVTALVGLLDPARNRVTLAGAGHHPVLLLNAGERRTTQIAPRGLALGLVGGGAFLNALVETTIDLSAGDSLLLYTDGATDSVAHVRAGVGENRFLAAAAAAVLPGPEGALERLREDLWQGGGRRDDTTLLLLARQGGPRVEAADRTSSAATA